MTVKMKTTSRKDWIEMFPYGLAIGHEATRPVMIFKDEAGRRVLPVWMSSIDAGIAMSQQDGQLDLQVSPHKLTKTVFEKLGLKLEKCFFKELKGSFQIVDLEFSGNKKINRIQARADEALSFCLSTDCQYFCQIEFIERCRILEGEIALSFGNVDRGETRHPYLN